MEGLKWELTLSSHVSGEQQGAEDCGTVSIWMDSTLLFQMMVM